jgi:hypothetical protein
MKNSVKFNFLIFLFGFLGLFWTFITLVKKFNEPAFLLKTFIDRRLEKIGFDLQWWEFDRAH